MPAHLYVAPAAGGKTTCLVDRARALTQSPEVIVRVVVPTHLQVRAWQRRLAETGGAMGVRVGTFDALYRQILREADRVYTRLSGSVQYRLLRLLAADAGLVHYRPLRAAPGFVQVVLDLIRELKSGGVFEDDLIRAIEGMGNEPRLRELAELYAAYQKSLRAEGWADTPGIGWLAQEALRDRPDVARDWLCVIVDGFDDLTSVQLALLSELSRRVGELSIALTGALDGTARPRAHRRFDGTRRRIQEALNLVAQPLPPAPAVGPRAPTLVHLEATLYVAGTGPEPLATRGSVTLVAAPDREGEVRAALRWLKKRIVYDDVRPRETALLARTLDAYRPYVLQIAAEYGLPVHAIGGLPLRSNPAVAATLGLLRLAAPAGGQAGAYEVAYPWRETVEAWRTPYFDWACIGMAGEDRPTAADALAWVAGWGSVIGGVEQWREAFALLQDVLAEERPESRDEEMPAVPDALDIDSARALAETFERFVERTTPPTGEQSCRAVVRWIEGLIGDEASPDEGPADDLGIARAVLDGPPALVERDREALIAFKDILRGLVWAEGALDCAPATFGEMLRDLQGAVNTATYRLPLPADQEAVVVADVVQARGVSYRAVAVLGLAEGEFPTALVEDPFLRDADRQRLKRAFDLQVDLTAQGAEAAYFYEAITRPREWLLLTRPRIADNGAPWQPSPFWEEVLRRVAVEPVELTSGSQPTILEAASWPELLRAVVARGENKSLWAWAMELDAERFAALRASTAILSQRKRVERHPGVSTTVTCTPYDGDLTQWGATFARRYGPEHTWSASRLESYRTCPYMFYVSSVLGLASRVTPAEGLDARQLGNLYHVILEEVYRAVDDPTDLEQLLAALPRVAAPILEDAPRCEQFRATAWWEQTQAEILGHVRDSLRALDELRGEYTPIAFEQAFGIGEQGDVPLVVRRPAAGPGEEDAFRMRGLIDRVDRAPDGRVRIVDYKTGGPWSFKANAFAEGKKLQLPLYALAAREALGLGEIADGYYWHVRHAAWHLEKARSQAWVSLAKMGVDEAIARAMVYVWETLRSVRQGWFAPQAPADGCPDYCPAAGFCWHYRVRGW
jgi:ATP-dependent helicase/nuclease subunit B